MAQWVLKANGNVVPRRSPPKISVAELHSDVEEKKRAVFDRLIEKRRGTAINPPKSSNEEDKFEEYYDDDEDQRVIPETEDSVDSKGRLLDQQLAYDQLSFELYNVHVLVCVFVTGDRCIERVMSQHPPCIAMMQHKHRNAMDTIITKQTPSVLCSP